MEMDREKQREELDTFLRISPYFQMLLEDTKAELASLFSRRSFQDGNIIANTTELSSHVLFFLSGSLMDSLHLRRAEAQGRCDKLTAGRLRRRPARGGKRWAGRRSLGARARSACRGCRAAWRRSAPGAASPRSRPERRSEARGGSSHGDAMARTRHGEQRRPPRSLAAGHPPSPPSSLPGQPPPSTRAAVGRFAVGSFPSRWQRRT